MNKNPKKKKMSSGIEILQHRYVKGDPIRRQIIEDELINLNIAQQIYDLRKEAGLKQSDLAALIGTTASVISRLEDCDYEGHSLTMLKKIAKALNKKIEIRIIDNNDNLRTA